VVAIALKTIREAARFIVARFWVRTRIGPYVVTTTEVRPGAYETGVTWGEDGAEIEDFGEGLAFDIGGAKANHKAICEQVEAEAGLVGIPAPLPPVA
jgi:hypothetical protein